jgi:hypothetical protein
MQEIDKILHISYVTTQFSRIEVVDRPPVDSSDGESRSYEEEALRVTRAAAVEPRATISGSKKSSSEETAAPSI